MIKKLSWKSSWCHFSWSRYINLIDFSHSNLVFSLPCLQRLRAVWAAFAVAQYWLQSGHECRSGRKAMLKILSVWIPAPKLVHSRSLLGLQDNQMELKVCCEVWTYVCLMDRIKILIETVEGVINVRTGKANISRNGTAGWQAQLEAQCSCVSIGLLYSVEGMRIASPVSKPCLATSPRVHKSGEVITVILRP